MATTTPDSSKQRSPSLADDPFLIALGFNFHCTNWDEFSDIATKAADGAKSLQLHIYNLLDARINKEVLSGDSMYEHATHLFRQESNMLLEKLTGLMTLLNEVRDTTKKHARLIRMAMRLGEDECEVESLFSPGTKICFKPEGRFDWFFG